MQIIIRNAFRFFLLFLVLISNVSFASGKLKESQIYTKHLSKDSAIHVHLFSTSEANLGNQKFRDTADAMAKSAPHLLATDIVGALRHSGFTAVSLDETEGEPSEDSLNLTGRFTQLNPGSQNLRVWIGFGAGKSKVCLEGELTDRNGVKLADFADCRSGLGWGSSAPQGDKGAEILGEEIARFLANWAEQCSCS